MRSWPSVWLVTGLFFVLSVGLTRPGPTDVHAGANSSDEPLVSAAEQAMGRGAWEEAESHLRQALATEPDHARAASLLRAIHDRSNRGVPLDESQVGETASILGPGFSRMTTRHFVILSDCDPTWARAKGVLLERSYRQFFRVMRRMSLEGTPPESRLLCVLINDHERYRAFAAAHDGIDAPWVAGYYASLSNRVVFYNDLTGPAFSSVKEQLDRYEASIKDVEARSIESRRSGAAEESQKLSEQAEAMREHLRSELERVSREAVLASTAKTLHEATHLLSFNCGLQVRTHQFPFWLTEGLATCFETEEADSSFGPDESHAQREAEFRRLLDSPDRLVPLGVLVQRTEVPGGASDVAEVMYAESYALFRYLFRFERERLAGLFRDIAAEPPGRVPPRRHLELFVARFGEPDALEDRWLRWERAGFAKAVASMRSP